MEKQSAPSASNQCFTRAERLKSRKRIDQLFKEGQSIKVFPLRLVWLPVPTEEAPAPVQATFTVPKRAFPKAVHRNRIKRQVREAYRLQKPELLEQLPASAPAYVFLIIYIGREAFPYKRIFGAQRKIWKIFQKTIREKR